MTQPDERSGAREIARGLTQALANALEPGAPAAAMAEARDAAQVLALSGLDRVLAALAPHAGRSWPHELTPAVGRIHRVALECEREGDVGPFRRVDPELAGIAAEIEAIEWGAGPRRGAHGGTAEVATLSAADVLADLPVRGEGPEAVREVRLTAQVAAALRAAVDWLSGEGGPRRPIQVSGEESALEVWFESVHPGGLLPAHEVLSSVGGNLGPPAPGRAAPPAPGGCAVRVPVFGPRTEYLMLVQGGLRLAVPWHAVLRVHVIAAAELAAEESEGGRVPVIGRLAPAAPGRGDLPVALIAHGLKRGYLVADRLVWRLAAEPCEAPGAPPAPGIERAVRTEDGEVYWLADPAVLLEGAPLPPLPEARRTPRGPRMLEANDVEALPIEVALEAPPAPPAIGPQTLAAIMELPRPRRPASADVGPASVEAGKRSEPTEAEPAPSILPDSSRGAGRVLIAEDSITARIFLTRMLGQLGFEVTAVERASELLAQLDRGPWALLCVDVELPDAIAPDLLRGVAARASAPLVALVRDHRDIEIASAAGVSRVLRKPFDPEALAALLGRLGLLGRGAS